MNLFLVSLALWFHFDSIPNSIVKRSAATILGGCLTGTICGGEDIWRVTA